MPALSELQRRFSAALFQGGRHEDDLLAVIALPAALARRRLAAYRRSVMGNLNGALESCYPVVTRIVGPAFFREAARQYILVRPSHSGDLNDFGGDFADFLADYPHAADLPYLPDVARLEWLVQGVYYAADADPAGMAALAAVAPEDYAGLRFVAAPDAARMDSAWPVVRIWELNQDQDDIPMTVDFSAGCRALVRRRHGRVGVEAFGGGEAALFDALAGGATLGTAAQRALETDPGLDLPAVLQSFVAARLFIAIDGPAIA